MQAFPEYVMQLRTDVRLLRVETDRLRRAHQTQKQKAERFQEQLKEQEQRIKELEKENEHLKGELEQSSKTKKRYQVALFDHGNFRHPRRQTKKKKGGQPGHADGTNNLAERELRPMVINRRISQGSNTFGGMETSAVLASLVQIASKHKAHVLACLQRSLQQGVTDLFPHSLHPVCLDSS